MKDRKTRDESSDERRLVGEYKAIEQDYKVPPRLDVFDEEPERLRRVKRIVMLELDPVDRTLMLLYADCGSLRALARKFRVSHTTMGTEIARIRRIILEKYNQTDKDK